MRLIHDKQSVTPLIGNLILRSSLWPAGPPRRTGGGGVSGHPRTAGSRGTARSAHPPRPARRRPCGPWCPCRFALTNCTVHSYDAFGRQTNHRTDPRIAQNSVRSIGIAREQCHVFRRNLESRLRIQRQGYPDERESLNPARPDGILQQLLYTIVTVFCLGRGVPSKKPLSLSVQEDLTVASPLV